jgi:hypothetical protein
VFEESIIVIIITIDLGMYIGMCRQSLKPTSEVSLSLKMIAKIKDEALNSLVLK